MCSIWTQKEYKINNSEKKMKFAPKIEMLHAFDIYCVISYAIFHIFICIFSIILIYDPFFKHSQPHTEWFEEKNKPE